MADNLHFADTKRRSGVVDQETDCRSDGANGAGRGGVSKEAPPPPGKITFTSNATPTVGIELELALVDAETMALSSSMPVISRRIPPELDGSIKPELMQCYVEINTEVCDTIAEAEVDLRRKLLWLQGVCDDAGLRLLWTGTHPFSSWREQQITEDERYMNLVDSLQEMARRLVCFGLHVHVGVDSGDKAVMICDRILRHLPMLLALSCNSPRWQNRNTGMVSYRAKVMEGLPTAGLPPLMRNWSEYVWLINHLIQTGFIGTIREIWWDVRPHHNFGTVEVRACDMPGNLEDCLALAALVQCLVKALSDMIDEGTYQHDCHPMLVLQNKWQACRFGLDAQMVDAFTRELFPMPDMVTRLLERLEPIGEQLQCGKYLDHVRRILEGPSWAQRQLSVFERTGDPAEIVRQLSQRSRLA